MKSRAPLRLFLLEYYFSPFYYCIFYNFPTNTKYSLSHDDADADADADADDQVAKPAATDFPWPEAAVKTKGLTQLSAPNLEARGGRRSQSSSPPDPPTQLNEAAAAQPQVDKRLVVAASETESIQSLSTSARASEGSGNSEERPKPSDFLTLAAACAVLIINIPARGTVESRLLVLYYAHITLLGLAFFLSMGFYVSSIWDADDRRVTKERKRTAMAAAVSLFAASISLRVAIALPAATTKYVLPPFLGGAVLVLPTLYCLIRKKATGQARGRRDIEMGRAD